MQARTWKPRARAWAPAAACAILFAFGTTSYAQSGTLSEVHTVAAADQAVPLEYNFSISLSGTYQVALVDLGAQLPTPAPLAAVKLAVTSGTGIVGTPLVAAGSMQFSAAVGQYVIHVIGKPGSVAGSGPIGIQVTDSSGNQITSISDTLALPPQALPGNEAVVDSSFTVSSSGNYNVTLADLNLPGSLTTLSLLLIATGGGSPLAILPDTSSGTPNQATVSLQPGITYRLFAVGQSSSTVDAGLYGVAVVPTAGGSPVFSASQPIGSVTLLGSSPLNAGQYRLAVTDLAYPAALSQVGAAVTVAGGTAAELSAAGNQTFTATANTYQVFGLGTAAASPGTGSYSVALQPQGGNPVLSVARAVSAPGNVASAYSFDATVTTAGSYSLDLQDYALPSAFASLGAVAVQGGAILGSPLSAAGSQNVTIAAGPASLLVFARAGASGGLFGVDLTAGGTASPVFATTQGVGQLFSARQISITTAGNYLISAGDVGFPAPLASFAVILTRGATVVGPKFGGGTLPFTATAGNYFVNFIAQPGGADEAGTYSLSVSPVPEVNLQSSAVTVTSGTAVTLTWTTQNATACTASGGWSGSQDLSGSAMTASLTSTSTFTLTCSGADGSTAQSVTVTVNAPPKKSGGGTLSSDLLMLLAGALLLRLSPALYAARWQIKGVD